MGILRRPAFPLVLLCCSLGVNLLASWLVGRATIEREQASFNAAVRATTERIDARMRVFIATLSGIATLFVSDDVSQEAFSDYVRHLGLAEAIAGAQGVAYAAQEADGSLAVRYVEPAEKGALLRGFDLLSESVRREGLARARETGEVTLGGKTALRGDKHGRPAFHLYYPLYALGSRPKSEHDRLRSFSGVVLAGVSAADFFSATLGYDGDLQLEIFDGERVVEEALLFSSGSEAVAARLHAVRTLTVAGRTWTLSYHAGPAFLSPIERALAPAMGVVGVIVSFVLFAFARSQARARRAAERTSAVLDSLFGATSAGLAIFDRQLRYVRLNESLADMHGVAVSEHIGRTAQEVLPRLQPEVVQDLRDVLASGEARDSEVRGAEHARTWLKSLAPVRSPEGEVVGVAEVVIDISERKRAEEELERRNHELDQFAYVTSHDLKAPLRGIASVCDWIEEDLGASMSAETRRLVHLMRSRVRRLEGLIEGILRFARASKSDEEPEDIDVRAAIEDAVSLLSPPSEARISIATPMPVIRASRVLFQQVLLNLIGNALKYGGGWVTLSARKDKALWEFSVADRGPGIAPEFHEKIWGIFQTLQSRDEIESSGIGLSVVRKIVTNHGGKAWVESRSGEGATFRFTWPA